VGSNLALGMGIYLLLILCVVLAEVTATGRSPVHGSPQCLCLT
jgi:hypothetical protein